VIYLISEKGNEKSLKIRLKSAIMEVADNFKRRERLKQREWCWQGFSDVIWLYEEITAVAGFNKTRYKVNERNLLDRGISGFGSFSFQAKHR
jgi:hypothetical protein